MFFFFFFLIRMSFKIKVALSFYFRGKKTEGECNKMCCETDHRWCVAALGVQLCSGFLIPNPIHSIMRASHATEDHKGEHGS